MGSPSRFSCSARHRCASGGLWLGGSHRQGGLDCGHISDGFTLIELLVVIAIIAILASILFPALTKAKQQAQGVQCMGNTKQMAIAWRMYAEDHNDDLVPNLGNSSWYCGAWESLNDPRDPSNWDSDTYVRKSGLWPYCGKSLATWHCPGDRSRAIDGTNHIVPRIRSISMNGGVGVPAGVFDNSPSRCLKLADITNPGPSSTFVFLDEREDSINDGRFSVNMSGFPKSVLVINDYPASYHLMAAGLAFADGHSEIHQWRDQRTMPPVGTNDMPLGVPSLGNKDAGWLQYHSPR